MEYAFLRAISSIAAESVIIIKLQYQGNVRLQPLKDSFKELFKQFTEYMQREVEVINDKQLEREYEQLHNIYECK